MKSQSKLSIEVKFKAYKQTRSKNFAESMRLEGYKVDTSMLELSASDKKKKKEELLRKYATQAYAG